jgi:hypothetical protein
MAEDDGLRAARAAGLTRFIEEHPQQLRAALKSAADLARRLPRDLSPAEEPAHTLDLSKTPESIR